MTIKFSIPTGRGLELTSVCVDRVAFATAVRLRDSFALATHLAACAACRKVAADAVSSLNSAGVPFRTPSALREVAQSIIERTSSPADGPDEDAPDRIELRLKNGMIDSVDGAAAEIFRRGLGARWRMESGKLANPIRVEIEIDTDRFLLRLTPLGQNDAVVRLRRRRSPVTDPRKLEGAVFWTSLPYDDYSCQVIGNSGEKCFLLRIRAI